MPDKPAVDAADTQKVSADTETVEVKPEELLERLKNLEEVNAHLQESLDFQKQESKKAFEKRDKINEQLKASKEVERSKDDLQLYVQDLEKQLAEKDKALQTINDTAVANKKLAALKEVAIQQGIKEAYLDRLDKFVDLSEVDPEKPVSLRISVDSVKNSFPDLFSANSDAVDRALPNPKLTTGALNYDEQYQALLNTHPSKRKPDHYQKLAELKELMQG